MEQYIRAIIEKEEAMEEEQRPLFHTNCAENILRSANEQYQLHLEEAFFRGICPFGAGMQTENACGALLASLFTLGLLFGEDKPTCNNKMKAAVIEYVRRFEETFGSLKCSCIKEKHRDEQDTCTPVKVKAGMLLEQVVKEAPDLYAKYLEAEGQEK